MKKSNTLWFTRVLLIITAAVAGTPLAGRAAPEVVAWGDNQFGQTTVPSELRDVVAIAAGSLHSLALTAQGRVVAWGHGEADVPSDLNNVVAIAAGKSHSLALTADGQVMGWGETTVPSGLSNVVAISAAAGGSYSLALTADGRVVGWGAAWGSEGTVPSGLSNVVAIAAGGGDSMDSVSRHGLALTTDGRVEGWGGSWRYVRPGTSYHPMTPVPSDLNNVVAIAAGWNHNLALVRQMTVPTPRLELSRGMSGLELQAQGASGISCLLLRASRLPGPWLPAEPVTFTNSVHRLRAPDTSEPAQFFRLLRK